MTTQTTSPVKTKCERHGSCRWLACPAGAGLLALRCGLAVLEVSTKTKRGLVRTCYRVQSFHCPKTQRVEGFTLVKLSGTFQDTDEIHHIDASFGPLPEKHWACDCKDSEYARPEGGCKHVRSTANALRKLGVLGDLIAGRLANLAHTATPTVCADLEAI